MRNDEPFGGTRRDVNRAIWRLNILEWMMLLAAALVAMIGGWFIAFLAADFGLPRRLTWILSSVLLFAVPGVSVLGRQLSGNGGPTPSSGARGAPSESEGRDEEPDGEEVGNVGENER